MSKKKVLLRGVFINRDTNGEGVLKVGTTLIRVSTVMGILYMDVLNKFLQAEINSKEYYESIINFINLYEIRKGEFEGNEYVIMKMDRDNFIIFSEYDDGEGGIQIPFSLSIYKNSLLDAINSYAQEKGVI